MIEVIKKVCFRCNTEKSLNQFYKHKGMADGHLNKCKNCTKKDTKKRQDYLSNDPVWVQSEKDRGRNKYHRLNYRGKHKPTPDQKKKTNKRYDDKYPEKSKIKSISSRLETKIKGNHKHHWSYNLEHAKDFIELSMKDHNKVHRFMTYDQKTFMYKDLNGNLLSTRTKHEEYINKVIRFF